MFTADPRLVAALRAWTREHDPHVRAAVELLINHDMGITPGRLTQILGKEDR